MITTANLYQSLGQNIALSWTVHNNYFAYYFYKVFHNSHNYQTCKTFNMTDCDFSELVNNGEMVAKVKRCLEDSCGCSRRANGGYCSQQFQEEAVLSKF